MNSIHRTVRSYGRSNQTSKNGNANPNDKERLREEYLRLREETNKIEKEPEDKEKEDVIVCESIEWYARINAEEHHTISFENNFHSQRPLILRRGQPFHIGIHFNRQFDITQDSVALEFTFGPNPRVSKGTFIRLPVTDNKSFNKPPEKWDVRLHRKEEKAINLEIQISCKTSVGVWSLNFISSKPNVTSLWNSFYAGTLIYILFNPWCKADTVYMQNETNRNEYVLNESGKLYFGTAAAPKSRRWIYGQFSYVVLPAAMAILNMSSLDDIARSSPVKVVRALSSRINCENACGVLQGKWSQPYDDGVAPFYWTGSTDILERYLTNDFQPVKYGQCWVFAGLFTTISRALGIPCRPITNFVSGHDTDDTLTIDRHYTEDGIKLEDDDSVWNYHVWNDCWMARPDLPSGYGGWQAVDATPQETSDGIYQAGPVSVMAVKRGQIGFMYDTPFVFSEVNADVICWQRDKSQRIGWRKFETNRYDIGQRILTKKAGIEDFSGDNDLEDITEQYKYKEGTPEERLAVRNAATHGNYAALFDIPHPGRGDVIFDMVELDKAMIGQSLSILVHVENKSDENRSVTASLTADSVFYTGIKAHRIKHTLHNFTLGPKQKELLTMRISTDEYYDKLVEYSLIKMYAVATVHETRQTWAEEDDISLDKPRLVLKVTQPIQLGQQFQLTVSFRNPLTRTLQKCSFVVESPGLTEFKWNNYGDINSEEYTQFGLSLVPKRKGKTVIFVVFNSQQLISVEGSIEIDVT